LVVSAIALSWNSCGTLFKSIETATAKARGSFTFYFRPKTASATEPSSEGFPSCSDLKGLMPFIALAERASA
jgi:hypothetical protein